ncbi:MAG: (d)CMP kinase, partial [Dehalococcoidia bacterium]|nr:(d)CMP kinase [Dehalococcoidia bacterium]
GLLYYTLDLSLQLITLDGPVAVGKTSVGLLLAGKLDFSFFDTGLMYRTFTWKVLKSGVSPDDEARLSSLAQSTRFDFVRSDDGRLSVFIDEAVPSHLLRSRTEGKVALVSKVAGVRQKMVSEQRRMALAGRLIMAGRDIGTVVLPWAELKIFLIASIEERAHRRHKELLEQGGKSSYDSVLAGLRRRDDNDIHRAISPLKPADDARIIDTESLALEQVVDRIYDLAIGFSSENSASAG